VDGVGMLTEKNLQLSSEFRLGVINAMRTDECR